MAAFGRHPALPQAAARLKRRGQSSDVGSCVIFHCNLREESFNESLSTRREDRTFPLILGVPYEHSQPCYTQVRTIVVDIFSLVCIISEHNPISAAGLLPP